jgi:hypothetical protein
MLREEGCKVLSAEGEGPRLKAKGEKRGTRFAVCGTRKSGSIDNGKIAPTIPNDK